MTGRTCDTYIALLPAVNAGGANTLPAKDFVALVEGLKLENVKTYIQTGVSANEGTPVHPIQAEPSRITSTMKGETIMTAKTTTSTEGRDLILMRIIDAPRGTVDYRIDTRQRGQHRLLERAGRSSMGKVDGQLCASTDPGARSDFGAGAVRKIILSEGIVLSKTMVECHYAI